MPPLSSRIPAEEDGLPGGAAAPFHARCNLLWQEQSRRAWRQPWLSMSFTAMIMARCWHLLDAGTTTWLLTSLALALADIAWRARWPASYARWRELPAALLCLNAYAPPATWRLMRRLLDDHGPPEGAVPWCGASGWCTATARMAAHIVRLVFASGAAKMAANALSLRVRLSLGAVVQAALVLAATQYTGVVCASRPLAHPAGQRMTHQLYRLLRTLAAIVAAGPEAGPTRRLGPAAECATVLAFLRILLALVAPLLYAALSEARLWQRHQREQPASRRTAPGPVLTGAARWLFWEDSWLHSGFLSWLLLAICWQLAELVVAV